MFHFIAYSATIIAAGISSYENSINPGVKPKLDAKKPMGTTKVERASQSSFSVSTDEGRGRVAQDIYPFDPLSDVSASLPILYSTMSDESNDSSGVFSVDSGGP